MNPNKNFGARMSEFRKAQGLSQEKLANKAKVDRSYVSRIEQGKVSPSLAIMTKISGALEVPLHRFVD